MATIATTVLVFTPWTSDAFGLPKMSVLTFGTVAAWVSRLTSARSVGLHLWTQPLARAATVLCAVTAVATAFSSSVADSFFGRYERYNGLLPLAVQIAFAAVVAVTCAGRPDRTRVVAGSVVVSGAVCAAYLLLQVVGLDPLEWREPSGRIAEYQAGTLGNSNFAGAFLALAAAFGVAATAGAAGRLRWVLVGCVGLCVAGVVAAQSRGGLLALIVAASAVVAVGAAPRLSRLSVAQRVMLATAALVVVGVAAGLASGSSLTRSKSMEIRARQWGAAYEIGREHPLLGTGPDTFQLHFPAHRPTQDGRELGLQLADKPHNLVLEAFQSAGVPGFAAYLAVLVCAVLAIVRAARLAPGDRLVVAGLAGAVAGHVAQGLVSIDVVPVAMSFWVACALVIAISTSRDEVRVAPPAWRAPAVVVSVVLLVMAWPISRPWRADWATARGDHDRAVELNPWQPVFHLNRGAAAVAALANASTQEEAVRSFHEGRAAFAEVRRLQPRSVFAAVGTGRVASVAAARLSPTYFRTADEAYARAADLDPVDWQIYDEWAALLNAWANAARGDEGIRRRALDTYREVLDIRPDHRPAWLNVATLAESLGDDRLAAEARAEAARLPG